MASNCTRMIEVDRLFFADNVRTLECEDIPAIVESFRRHGFKPNHPLVGSEKVGDDGPTFLVLNGNRRGKGLVWLRDNEPNTYARILPNGKIPMVVHKGLTREEEVDLRIDHSSDEDRVPLDEWSIYLAIKQLVKVGIDTQERIAIKLGLYKTTGKNKGQPQREYVQQRTNLVRLPSFVEEEYRKLTLDKDSTRVRWAKVPTLFKMFNKEYVDHPSGDGPEFSAYWTALVTPPEPMESGGATDSSREPKELSPVEAIKRSQSASSAMLKQALLVVTRQSAKDLSEIDAKMVAAETALFVLADVKDYLGEKDYAELVDAATKQGNDRRNAEMEPAENGDVAENQEVAV